MAPHRLEPPMSPLSLTRTLSRSPSSLAQTLSPTLTRTSTRVSKKAPLSEEFGEPFEEQTKTFREVWAESVSKYPDNAAIACVHQPADLYDYSKSPKTSYLKWTFQELDKAASALAMNLTTSCGMNKGMPIATLLYNTVESQIVFIAALKAGLPFTPINPRNLGNVEEVEHMLKVSGAKGIVVADGKLATKLSTELPDLMKSMALTSVVDTAGASEAWTSFSILVDPLILGCPVLHLDHVGVDDVAVIFFTSGSTSRPKACPHTSRTFGSGSRMFFGPMPEIDETVVGLLASPNNHVIFTICAVSYWAVGASIVLPGLAYSPKEMLKALELEKCTDVGFIPTMAHQMIREIQSSGIPKPTCWKRATLGGAPVSLAIMQSCRDGLGVESVGTAFGMTEGFATNAGYYKDVEKIGRFNGSRVSSGYVLPGAHIRVAYPGTRQAVPRGEFGELHFGGPQMFLGYLGKDRRDDWYTDDDGEWFNSGDQAVMEDDGSIVITGRYKDILIRGGENVSPALIESVLGSIEGIEAAVIGVPDDFAGEVPVAIIKATVPYSEDDLGKKVVEEIGAAFVPESYINIKDLGMESWPTTTTGKIKKPELAVFVRDYLAKLEEAEDMSNSHTADVVNQLWSKLLGHKIDPNTPVQYLADSIAIVRFLDGVHKKLGKNLTVDDVTKHQTIKEQVYFLDSMSASPVAKTNGRVVSQAKRREGPPTADDMVHVADDEEIAKDTIKAVESVIKAHGLTFDDVQDVTPVYDQGRVYFQKRRFHSWSVRGVLLPKQGSSIDVQTMTKAFEAAIDSNPMLAAFMVPLYEGTSRELPLWVTIHPSEKWYEKLVTTGHEVEKVEDLRTFGLDDPNIDNAELPGPLLKAHIVHVKERQSAAIVMTFSHATFDGMSLQLFFEDLHAALAGEEIEPHDDYKIWSDNYFMMRKSYTAEAQTRWHIARLQGLEQHKAALFPHQRAPEWFHGGSNTGWEPSPSDLQTFENPHRKNLNSTICTDSPLHAHLQSAHLPDLRKLRETVPGLTGPVILKAAIALFNTRRTGHTHALFSSLEAARSELPFLTGEMRDRLAIDCSNVPGPLYQRNVDLIEVRPGESVVALLARLQKLQTTLTKYASAPDLEIMKGLSADAAAMVEDVGRRQILNWAPGVGAMAATKEMIADEKLELVFGRARTDEGFIWIAGMGGEDNQTCYLRAVYDDANFKKEEAAEWVREVLRIVSWVAEEGNWKREVGAFTEAV